MAEPDKSKDGLLVELSRPLASDEETKISTFMKVRNVDRPTAMKFLMGRKMDVDRAHLLLTNYQKTILERHFEKVAVTDVAKELKTAKMYIPGSTDRNKAQLLVIDATKHDPTAFTHDDTIRLAFFMGQKVTERPSVWENGLTLIVNMSGYTWAQWDMALQRQILGLFTDNIPARVKNILLFDAPWWISTLVRIVTPFLKPKMRERLQLCDKDNIQNWIEAANLPIQFGGMLQYDHEAFIERCIEDIGDDQFRRKLHLDGQGREITAVPIEELIEVLPESALTKKIDLEPAKKEALEQERAEAVALFDERIEMLKESSKHNRVREHKDFFHLLRYRATRLSLDLSMLQQRPQPNMSESHSVKSVSESPIADVSGEDNDPEALRKRIKKNIEAKIAQNTGKPYTLSLDSSPSDEEILEKDEPEAKSVKSPEVINEDLEVRRRRAADQRRPIVSKPAIEAKEEPINLSSSSSSSSDKATDDATPIILVESPKQVQKSEETKPKQEAPPSVASVPSEVPSEQTTASPTQQRRGRGGRAARVKPIDSSFEPPILPIEPKEESVERLKSDESSESGGIAVVTGPENANRDSISSLRPISTVTTNARDSVASLRPISTVSDVNRTSMTSLAPVDVHVEDVKQEPLGPINEEIEGMVTSMTGNRRRQRKRSGDANARRQVHIGGSTLGAMLGMSGKVGELSAYELKRLENIRQNQKILESLEIPKLAPVEQVAKNTANQASRPKKASSRGRKAVPKPSRVSARILQKLEEEKTGGKKKTSFDLLTELPEPQPKERKPRPLPGSRVPFAPEDGATEGFVSMMKAAQKTTIVDVEPAKLPDGPRMGIKSAPCVTKVLQDRIYSVALHPSQDKIIAATGSKSGQLAFWDATSLYHDHDTTFDGSQAAPYYLFHPHSGSLSTLRYCPGNASQLLSCGYEGSIQCMDIVKGCFETVYTAPKDLDEQYISTFDFFNGTGGNVLGFSDMSGFVSIMDRRASQSKVERFHLHTKKVGGMSVSPVNPDLIATCSLDNVVCIWDRRQMSAEDSSPLAKFDYKRAVTAVNFHPTKADTLVSTCYDDHVRIHHNALSEKPIELSVRHNNQTGRWITTFKAFWDPKSSHEGTSQVIVGDMNRGVDLIDGASGVTHNFTSEFLTAQPAVNAAHSSLDLIVSGNASGKLALWTPF